MRCPWCEGRGYLGIPRDVPPLEANYLDWCYSCHSTGRVNFLKWCRLSLWMWWNTKRVT